MDTLIQEKSKEFRKRFDHDPKCPTIEDDVEDCICMFGEMFFFLLEALTSVAKANEKNMIKKLPNASPFNAQLAQNRNGLDYCSTCEQAWEYCSCSARNTGFNKCLSEVKSLITSLQKGGNNISTAYCSECKGMDDDMVDCDHCNGSGYEEIPQFKGTLEALDKLTLIKKPLPLQGEQGKGEEEE